MWNLQNSSESVWNLDNLELTDLDIVGIRLVVNDNLNGSLLIVFLHHNL